MTDFSVFVGAGATSSQLPTVKIAAPDTEQNTPDSVQIILGTNTEL